MQPRSRQESGAILIVLMVTLTIAAIAVGAAVQAWSKTWRRDSEEELISRANQYVDGIIAYRKEHGGQFPTKLEDLYKPGPRRFRYIRKLFKDPIAKDGRWGLLYLMPGGQGIYDPKAAQKAQEKAAKDGGSDWETAGTGALAQGSQQGVTPINMNQYGSGVPGTGGMPAGSMPPVAIQGGMPPIPQEQEGGLKDGEEPISEPPIGWPIVGVISRASGKLAQDTFRIYKGHEHVDEWQFQVFDRGEQAQNTPATGQLPIVPMGQGPGIGGHYNTNTIPPNGGNNWFGRGGMPTRLPGLNRGGPQPGGNNNWPNQWPGGNNQWPNPYGQNPNQQNPNQKNPNQQNPNQGNP